MPAPEQPAHDEPVEPVDDDLFDESWEAPRKTNRLTVVLVVALLVVGGFAGGVLVQKNHDTALAAAAAGAGTRRAGGATGAGTGGGRGQGAQATAAPGSADTPVVMGTVRTVDTDAIEVTDQSGAIVRVFVPRTATVTTRGLGGLAYNTPVSVTGTKAVDGSVTATSVTVTATGGPPR